VSQISFGVLSFPIVISDKGTLLLVYFSLKKTRYREIQPFALSYRFMFYEEHDFHHIEFK